MQKIKKFKVNDIVVYPGHGVGLIDAIETKGALGSFYSIVIQDSGMKILVPDDKAVEFGLRPVADAKTAQFALRVLHEHHDIPSGTWARRYREYMDILKTGDLVSVARVLGGLNALAKNQELSFGERKLKDNAEALFWIELDAVLGKVS